MILAPGGFVARAGLGRPVATGGIPQNEYSSSFSSTEDPLSEAGAWAAVPTGTPQWTRMVSSSSNGGIAYGSNGANDTFDDSYAKFVGITFSSPTSLQIEAVLYRSGTLGGGVAYPEKELWFCIDDGSGYLKGYEIMLNPAGLSNMGKWLGGQDNPDIVVLANSWGLGADVPDGAVFKATISRSGSTNTISMYYNGDLQYSNTDTNTGGVASYTIGCPGIGAFARPASVGDHSKFAFKSVTITAI